MNLQPFTPAPRSPSPPVSGPRSCSTSPQPVGALERPGDDPHVLRSVSPLAPEPPLTTDPALAIAEETTLLTRHNYVTLFPNRSLVELSATSLRHSGVVQSYSRGCAWSPDGTCCLLIVNGGGQCVAELPRDLYGEAATPDRPVDVLDWAVRVEETGTIYDFCWYPGMNSSLPETCCWLSTRQHGPIQLWDAFDGDIRCTYRGFDSVDEMEPALSATFSVDGVQIFAGYKKCLRTFNTSRPGRDCSLHPIKAPASSLITNGKLLCVGSWNTSVSLYSINDLGNFKSIGKLHGHKGGVTQMKFTSDGLKLVTGARKDDKLLVWDLRHYRRPLNILTRKVDTNQRIYFDISPCGRYLVSGGTDGVLRVWDSIINDWSSASDFGNSDEDATSFKFPLHSDCCNSVSIHPYRPIIATGSGQHHGRDPIESLSSNEDIPLSASNDNFNMEVEDRSEVKSENSLVFWWIGTVSD